MNKIKKKYILIPILSTILCLLYMIVNTSLLKGKGEKNYIKFTKDLESKQVSSVYDINSPNIKVKLKNGTIYTTDNPRYETFKADLLKNGVKVYENSLVTKDKLIPSLILFASLFSMGFITIYTSKGKGRGMFSSVSSMEVSPVEKGKLLFNDVAGNEEAKESVKDIVDFLKTPEKYKKYGARVPKGIILYGPPGTGKTLMAKAIAGEANVPFYAVSGSDFVQIYVGVGAARIRNLFKKAKNEGKAVIFIDEIDAVGKKRSASGQGGSDEREQTLNALLTEMSGFNEDENIIVIAATNRLDTLDEALLRPGRFDRHVEISLPDLNAREKILNLHVKNKPFNHINLKELAKKTSYFSGAQLENLVNESAILACKESSPFIEEKHIDKAYSIVLAGYEKINREHIKEKDKKITAYHEIGHAFTSLYLLPEEKVSKVTIIPTTKGAGGYTLSIPEDKLYQNKDYLYKRIMVLLGGRAAEEIIFGKDFITTGASNDLEKSTEIVYTMITRYGMGETLGLLSLNIMEKVDLNIQNKIIEECKLVVNNLYEDVKNILVDNKDKLCSLSEELLSKETLFELTLNN